MINNEIFLKKCPIYFRKEFIFYKNADPDAMAKVFRITHALRRHNSIGADS